MTEFAIRLRQSSFALLVTTTILICTLWQGVLYPFGLASKPSGRRMTSTFVGEAAANNQRWALVLAPIIDKVFMWLGDRPDHCERAYLGYSEQDD